MNGVAFHCILHGFLLSSHDVEQWGEVGCHSPIKHPPMAENFLKTERIYLTSQGLVDAIGK